MAPGLSSHAEPAPARVPTDPVATSPRPLGTRERRRIRVSGIVQGLGFRPFVFGLAGRYGHSPEGTTAPS